LSDLAVIDAVIEASIAQLAIDEQASRAR